MSEGAEAFPFLGRSGELATLRRLIHDARQGTGQAAIMHGEAGIGKTRLLTEIIAHAAGEGFQVLSGATDELARDRPLGALIDAFGLRADSADPERAEIGRLIFPDPLHAPVADLGFRVIDASVALLARLATEAPVVVAFEDLHWADPATLRAVRAIGRALPGLPVALLVTLRSYPESPELVQVIDELVSRGAAQLALPALDDPAVAALAEAVAGAPPGAELNGQLSWAAGNPLFVIELVKALHEQGSLTVHQGRADVADRARPHTLPLTILRRMSFLPPATLDVLTVAAVLGREFSVAQLAAVTGRSPVTLLPDLDGALRAGLLGESPAGLAFRHELMREVIYHDLAGPLRQSLHREVARALTAAGLPAIRLADHLYLGACTTDPESIRWLRQAAAQAAPRSPAVAVKLCERAFELTGIDDPNREAIAAQLAPLLLQTGRPKDAERVAREVLTRGPTPAHEVALRRALGEILWAIGWLEPAVAELEAAAGVPGATERDRAGSLALAANIRLFVGDRRAEARTVLQLGRRLGEERGNMMWLPLYHAVLAMHHVMNGELTDAGAEVEAGLMLADEVGTRLHAPLLHGVAGLVALLRGDRCQGLLDDDPAMLLAAVDAYRRLPRTVELALACEDAGAALSRAGRGAEAVPLLDEALDFYLQTGAQRGAARVEAVLRGLGIRRRRSGSGQLRRTSMGWNSLTRSELVVAGLAAEGLTNPQIGDRLFISRRTVATHLANVFRKLGITNRVQLATEVSRRRSDP
ncbi:MAG: helix-turn-helix transcriptional regulator [Pseudonocardiaceae bacterium]